VQTINKTFTILDEELELCELHDINTYGMSQGVSGFIYSSDLHDKFEKYEDEILDTLNEYCFSVFDQSAEDYIVEQLRHDDEHWTMQQFYEFAVWMYVEMRAQEIVEAN
tara:strand:+ start:466 stop:792 length:327 start_codon:yes stop_codon:yes gene_type:complete